MKNIDLEIVKKDSITKEIRITRNGVAEDISGWYIYFTVKADFNNLDASAIISKTIQFPSNAESIAGIGYLPLTTSDTDKTIGDYFYDMKLVDGTYRETFLRGRFNILPTARLA